MGKKINLQQARDAWMASHEESGPHLAAWELFELVRPLARGLDSASEDELPLHRLVAGDFRIRAFEDEDEDEDSKDKDISRQNRLEEYRATLARLKGFDDLSSDRDSEESAPADEDNEQDVDDSSADGIEVLSSEMLSIMEPVDKGDEQDEDASADGQQDVDDSSAVAREVMLFDIGSEQWPPVDEDEDAAKNVRPTPVDRPKLLAHLTRCPRCLRQLKSMLDHVDKANEQAFDGWDQALPLAAASAQEGPRRITSKSGIYYLEIRAGTDGAGDGLINVEVADQFRAKLEGRELRVWDASGRVLLQGEIGGGRVMRMVAALNEIEYPLEFELL